MKCILTVTNIAAGLYFAAAGLRAADAPRPVPGASAASVEQRLQKLEQSQERLLKELVGLRKLLEEKSEFAVRKTTPERPSVIPLNIRGEPFRGQSDARVAIVEYSDFACPYCAEFVRELYPRIEAEYIKSGKVKYFFRDLPERGHTNAWMAAQAARCAGEQGKFWEMHDLLFATQAALAGLDLPTLAQGLGLDTEELRACIDHGRWAEAIQRSAAGARRLELYGTPAFLIGTVSEDGNVVRATKTVVGGASFEALKSALDELLTSPAKSSLPQLSRAP